MGAETIETPRTGWAPRPVLTFLVRALAVAVPVLAGFLAGTLTAALLPDADGLDRIAWWAAVIGAAAAATMAADALARRLLPLSVLLRLTLAFPDHAPSRVRVALRATSVRRLQDRVMNGDELDLPAAERAADIVTLAAALNAHDRRTRGHSERVQALTKLVAEEMHLDPDEQERLGWAAFLHDIGKLQVPPSLLNKPGPPDEDEWRVLRRHPEDGTRLVAPLRPWLGDATGAIGDHHEHYDGTGYPRGLAGEEISRAGRIVAVADAFETITAARAYKRPITAGDARAEITRCAGSHFDPHVVRAFLEVSRGRLRWLIGLAGALTLVPFLGVTRARAASLRPAVTGGGTGVVGAAFASVVLATAPLAPGSAPPTDRAAKPPEVSAPNGAPGTTTTASAAGGPSAGPSNGGTDLGMPGATDDPSGDLVHVDLEALVARATIGIFSGVSVTPAPGSGVDAQLTTR